LKSLEIADNVVNVRGLLLRAIAECFARLSHGLSVCPSVLMSVRHTAILHQNGAR